MNIPKNHHYVSQCHQKGFFDDKKGVIYLYDKELDNYYHKHSSKRLFSEDHLNTQFSNGVINQTTLEKELKILFEDNFTNHIKRVQKFLVSQVEKQEAYESLCWLTLLGILGEFRHPFFKKEIDKVMLDIESDFIGRFYAFPKDEIKTALKNKQKTPFSNVLSYAETAIRILERMEPLNFFIVSIESNDHFFLPDTSCFQLRGQLRNYPNPYIQEIIQVGVPLTDKLYILATPRSLKSGKHGIKYEREENSELVFEINKDLYEFARKSVACKDHDYLKDIVKKIKTGCT